MSGDRPAITVTSDRNTVLTRGVEALGRFPNTQPWVLIGDIAVFIRLGSITRPTADADTVARSQAEQILQLLADEITTVATGGDVQVPIGDGVVEIGVMDLADDPLPVTLSVECSRLPDASPSQQQSQNASSSSAATSM